MAKNNNLPALDLKTGNPKKDLKKFLPEAPGVYLFSGRGKILYIGKANYLARRVLSYFSPDGDLKTKQMIRKADNLSFIRVDSEFEALLLEARMIRKYKPQYNIISKDDKHPLYIKITKEKYPRVLTVRKSDNTRKLAFYGPFPSSRNVSSVLKNLRKIFPFSDHKVEKRKCIYSHLRLCSPCPSDIEKIKDPGIKEKFRKIYIKNIHGLNSVLSGKIEKVKKDFLAQMRNLSRENKFEEAQILKEKLEKLEYITQERTDPAVFMESPGIYQDARRKELAELQKIIASKYPKIKKVSRVECYDVAHLAGTFPTASMVTFINAEPEKSLYRHFRISKVQGGNDVGSLEEVVRRRKKYFETWGVPDLIIVDGGRPQLKAFAEFYNQDGIPVAGLAKRFETLIFLDASQIKVRGLKAGNLLQRLRDEAHRFARRYHHHLIQKNMLPA